MIRCQELYTICRRYGFTFFCGVPDSTFKDWMSFLDDQNGHGLTHRIATIERDAIGWAAGYYVATGQIGVVYMQNSGLGNVVNPLTSLTAPEVYNIPLLFMVGWRGEPGGKPDEPQHLKMGALTLPLLDLLGIRFSILPNTIQEAEQTLKTIRQYLDTTGLSYALVIRTGTFEAYTKRKQAVEFSAMTREEAIQAILKTLVGDEYIVATTGKTSRELFEYREATQGGHHHDFLMVGSMGLASSFAAEIALQKPDETVMIFDGDGALLMNAGALSTIGYYAPPNLYHILFDNGAHDSTGGQPTTSAVVDFETFALAQGYKTAQTVTTREELERAVQELKHQACPSLLVIKVKKGARPDLGRPRTSPIENRNAFMNRLTGDSYE